MNTLQNRQPKKQYIVIQLISGEGHCKIIPEDNNYPEIYSQVYGPASRSECKRWVEENCKPEH